MLTLISFLVTIVGCANWLTIGLLQFDFVAGLFGSQSNIFSRIVYVLVGVAAAILVVNLIKNKGKITFNLKKMKKEKNQKLAHANVESAIDNSKKQNNTISNTEAGKDYSREDSYHHYPNPSNEPQQVENNSQSNYNQDYSNHYYEPYPLNNESPLREMESGHDYGREFSEKYNETNNKY